MPEITKSAFEKWATTQSGIGNSLREQSTRAEGSEAVRLLGEAASAYRRALEGQRPDFKVEWSFAGTRNFISQSEQFAGKRAWLLGLLEAMGGKNRDAILEKLRALKN